MDLTIMRTAIVTILILLFSHLVVLCNAQKYTLVFEGVPERKVDSIWFTSAAKGGNDTAYLKSVYLPSKQEVILMDADNYLFLKVYVQYSYARLLESLPFSNTSSSSQIIVITDEMVSVAGNDYFSKKKILTYVYSFSIFAGIKVVLGFLLIWILKMPAKTVWFSLISGLSGFALSQWLMHLFLQPVFYSFLVEFFILLTIDILILFLFLKSASSLKKIVYFSLLINLFLINLLGLVALYSAVF